MAMSRLFKQRCGDISYIVQAKDKSVGKEDNCVRSRSEAGSTFCLKGTKINWVCKIRHDVCINTITTREYSGKKNRTITQY